MLLSDPNIKMLISSVTFFSLFLFCYGIVQYLRQREKRREVDRENQQEQLIQHEPIWRNC